MLNSPSRFGLLTSFAGVAATALSVGAAPINVEPTVISSMQQTVMRVPEPATYALIGIGLVGLSLLHRNTRTRE